VVRHQSPLSVAITVLAVALDMRVLGLSCCFLRRTVPFTSGLLDGDFSRWIYHHDTICVSSHGTPLPASKQPHTLTVYTYTQYTIQFTSYMVMCLRVPRSLFNKPRSWQSLAWSCHFRFPNCLGRVMRTAYPVRRTPPHPLQTPNVNTNLTGRTRREGGKHRNNEQRDLKTRKNG
jgi:hypothetical protein